MREAVRLHRVQAAILEFSRGNRDVVVFGAQAVNVHVQTARTGEDVTLPAAEPPRVANELARALADRLHIATRVREVATGRGFRVYQVRKEGNRHLADIRAAEFALGDSLELDGIRYVSVPLAIALKVRALVARRMCPKGGTDLADLRRLLLAHPELRAEGGPVSEALRRVGASEAAWNAWEEIRTGTIVSEEDADEGY
jgi:hypothetical protein